MIRASHEALERLDGRLDAEPYDDGDEIAPGITTIHIGKLCPDEYALHIGLAEGAIAFADALLHYGDALSFVPHELMGDDPATVKDGLENALRGLLTRDFDHLLFAHGEPLIGGGKAARARVSQGPVSRRIPGWSSAPTRDCRARFPRVIHGSATGRSPRMAPAAGTA